jgi:hypothetical protein
MDPISIRVAWGRLKGNHCIPVSYLVVFWSGVELYAEKKVFLAMSVLSSDELVEFLPVLHFKLAGEKLLSIRVCLIV